MIPSMLFLCGVRLCRTIGFNRFDLEADYKVRNSNVIPQSGALGLLSQRLFPFTVDSEDGFDCSPTVFTAITR